VLTHPSNLEKGEKSLKINFLNTAKLWNHPACWGEREEHIGAYPSIAEHICRLYPWNKILISVRDSYTQKVWRPQRPVLKTYLLSAWSS